MLTPVDSGRKQLTRSWHTQLKEARSMSPRPRSTFIALCLAFVILLSPHRSSASNTAEKAGGDAGASSSDYVGSEVCVTCHADQQKSFEHTIMGNAMMLHPKTSQEKLGCEGCHGPGKAHVDAGGAKDTIPVRFTKDSNTPV